MSSGVTTSPFDLKCSLDSGLVLTADPKYKKDDKTTCSKPEFYSRIYSEFIQYFDDMDWKNVLMAGGFVSALMEKNYDQQLYENSDIDLFVYGDINTIRKRMKEMCKYFSDKLGKVFMYGFKNVVVVNILSTKYKRPIQLIALGEKNPMRVLESFDLTHCQVGFNGTDVLHTSDYIKSQKSHITRITTTSIQLYRIIKAYKRGYSVISNFPNVYLKNFYYSYIWMNEPGSKQKFPVNTDKQRYISKLDENLDEIMNNEIIKKHLSKSIKVTDEDTLETFQYKLAHTYMTEEYFDEYKSTGNTVNAQYTTLSTSIFLKSYIENGNISSCIKQ